MSSRAYISAFLVHAAWKSGSRVWSTAQEHEPVLIHDKSIGVKLDMSRNATWCMHSPPPKTWLCAGAVNLD